MTSRYASGLASVGLAVAAVVLGTMPALAFATQAAAAAGNVPEQVVIKTVSVKKECKQSAVVKVSLDREAFTVVYQDFMVEVGAGATAPDSRGCMLTIRIEVPAGYSYAISHVDYRGFAAIADGANGLQNASYKIQGEGKGSSITHRFASGFDGSFAHHDDLGGARDWSKCGKERKIDIAVDLRVNAGTSDSASSSQIALDSQDFDARFGLLWKTCTK